MKIRVLAISPFVLSFVLFTSLILATTTTPAPGTVSTAKKKRKKRAAVKPATQHAKPMTAKVSSLSEASSKQFVATVATPSKTFRPKRRRGASSLWDEPTYADSTLGDNVDGEDLDVRRAAVEA